MSGEVFRQPDSGILRLLRLVNSLLGLADGRFQVKLIVQVFIDNALKGVRDALRVGGDRSTPLIIAATSEDEHVLSWE